MEFEYNISISRTLPSVFTSLSWESHILWARAKKLANPPSSPPSLPTSLPFPCTEIYMLAVATANSFLLSLSFLFEFRMYAGDLKTCISKMFLMPGMHIVFSAAFRPNQGQTGSLTYQESSWWAAALPGHWKPGESWAKLAPLKGSTIVIPVSSNAPIWC